MRKKRNEKIKSVKTGRNGEKRDTGKCDKQEAYNKNSGDFRP